MASTAKICVQCDGWGVQHGCETRNIQCKTCRGSGIVYIPTPESLTLPPAKQRVMFSGLDCLPGQQDLFPTDGE